MDIYGFRFLPYMSKSATRLPRPKIAASTMDLG